MTAATDNALPARTRREFATLWATTGETNHYGEPVVDAPVEIRCRIERGTSSTLAEANFNLRYDHQLNVDRDIAIGSLLWLGALVDVPSNPEFFEVIDFEKIPNTRCNKFDRWVKLIRSSDKTPNL